MEKSNQKYIQRNDYEILRIMMETLVAYRMEEVPNDTMKMDIATVKAPKELKGITTEKPNWRMIVDTFTGLKWSNFYVMNNGMIKTTCEFSRSGRILISLRRWPEVKIMKNKRL